MTWPDATEWNTEPSARLLEVMRRARDVVRTAPPPDADAAVDVIDRTLRTLTQLLAQLAREIGALKDDPSALDEVLNRDIFVAEQVDLLPSPRQMTEDLVVRLHGAYQVVFDTLFGGGAPSSDRLIRALARTEPRLIRLLQDFGELLRLRLTPFPAARILEASPGEFYYVDYFVYERRIDRQNPASIAHEAERSAEKDALAGPVVPVARFFDEGAAPEPARVTFFVGLLARIRQIQLVRKVLATCELMRARGLRPPDFHPADNASLEGYLQALHDEWRQVGGSTEGAYLRVLCFLREYLLAFTMPVKHNVLDTGVYGPGAKNYLRTEYPRAVTGQYLHDCAIFAVRVLRVLAQFGWYVKDAPLELRLLRMPVHVGVLVLRTGEGTESLPIAIVHNNQLWTFPKRQVSQDLAAWRQAGVNAGCGASTLDAFAAELATIFYFHWFGIHLPYRLHPLPVWRRKLDAGIWSWFLRHVIRGPGLFRPRLPAALDALHRFYLTYSSAVARFASRHTEPAELFFLPRAWPKEPCTSAAAERYLEIAALTYACLRACYHHHFIPGDADRTVVGDCVGTREQRDAGVRGRASLEDCRSREPLGRWTVERFNQEFARQRGLLLVSNTDEVCLPRIVQLFTPWSVAKKHLRHREALSEARGPGGDACAELPTLEPRQCGRAGPLA